MTPQRLIKSPRTRRGILPAAVMMLAAVSLAAQAPPDTGTPEEEPVRLAVDIEYHPEFPHDAEPGDLYVYLDGDLLAWVSRGGQFAPSAPTRFDRPVAPGRHVLRLLHEHHEPRTKGRFEHEARASDVEILFHLEPGDDARLELRVVEETQVFEKFRGPIDVTVTQGGRTIQSREQVGERLRDWPLLCESIEANLEPGAKVTRKMRKVLEDCVRWEALWRSVDDAPARAEVRKILARYAFQPSTYKRFE